MEIKRPREGTRITLLNEEVLVFSSPSEGESREVLAMPALDPMFSLGVMTVMFVPVWTLRGTF